MISVYMEAFEEIPNAFEEIDERIVACTDTVGCLI